MQTVAYYACYIPLFIACDNLIRKRLRLSYDFLNFKLNLHKVFALKCHLAKELTDNFTLACVRYNTIQTLQNTLNKIANIHLYFSLAFLFLRENVLMLVTLACELNI